MGKNQGIKARSISNLLVVLETKKRKEMALKNTLAAFQDEERNLIC